MSDLISITELKKSLRVINECNKTATEELDDGTINELGQCSIQVMCDDCIARFAAMLDWACDEDEDEKQKSSEGN